MLYRYDCHLHGLKGFAYATDDGRASTETRSKYCIIKRVLHYQMTSPLNMYPRFELYHNIAGKDGF